MYNINNANIEETQKYLSWLRNNIENSCGVEIWVANLTELLRFANDIPYFAEKIKACYGGMGSINDLAFYDKS